MKKHPHKKVLEIGCGNEPLFKYVKDVEQWVVVEPAEEFYNKAIKSAGEMENVILLNDYFERTIEEIRSMGIEFDYVVCSSLLHELDEPDKLLKAIYELCSEQTIVNIIVPNAKSVHRLLAHCMGMIPDIYCKSEMQTIMQQSDVVYDTDSLGERCRKNGFKVIDSGSFFVKFFSHKQMQACLDNGIFDETLLEGLDKLVEYMPEYGSEIWVELVKRMTKEI